MPEGHICVILELQSGATQNEFKGPQTAPEPHFGHPCLPLFKRAACLPAALQDALKLLNIFRFYPAQCQSL